ncbi:MAG: hypothetical protein Q9220_004041 [cf. Caloplaca sp. 1 TL-2023]
MGLAVFQAGLHIYDDYDRVPELEETPLLNATSDGGPRNAPDPISRMKTRLPGLLKEIGVISLALSILGPIIYSLTVRRMAWSMSLSTARFLRYDIPATEKLSYIPPYHITLIFRSLTSAFGLLLLWRVSNLAFDTYVAQSPLKRARPFTQDSQDPDGSLINGLKSTKNLVKAFAFWELKEIVQRFPERRKLIFRDIDRLGGPAWSQISGECITVLHGVTLRINEHGKPPAQQQQQALIKPEQLQSLPRIGAPLRQEPVVMNTPPPTSRREMVETKVGSFAKSYGNNPVASSSGGGSPMTTPTKTQQYLEAARNKLLSREQQQAISPANVQSQFSIYLTKFLQSPLGYPFRHTFARRVCSVAFGHPFSDLGVIVNAVESLTALTTASLKEDDYGIVAKDIPLIFRMFIMTFQTLETFTATLEVHWTDVEFQESQRREVEDVRRLQKAIREGLGKLLEAFGGLKREVGLGEKEVGVARGIVGMSSK